MSRYTHDEVLNALHVIQNICAETRECCDCPLACGDHICALKSQPNTWTIREPDSQWRAFEEPQLPV